MSQPAWAFAAVGECAYRPGRRSWARLGSSPIATNSVAPMPNPPSASARRARRMRAGDNSVGPWEEGGMPPCYVPLRPHSPRENAVVVAKRPGKRPLVRFRGGQGSLEALDFSGEFARVARADVRLEHEGHPRPERADGFGGRLDDGEHLVPLALDRGEHGV